MKLESLVIANQNVAVNTGSAACPTAGLHFTEEMLSRLDAKGIERAFVTLHVGLGTFLPVREEMNAKINLELSTTKAEKDARVRENMLTAVSESQESDTMENSIFQRIKENDRNQWKNSGQTETVSSAADY